MPKRGDYILTALVDPKQFEDPTAPDWSRPCSKCGNFPVLRGTGLCESCTAIGLKPQ